MPLPKRRNRLSAITPAGRQKSDASETHEKANLSTLFGVFFPCIQNIFGVIYFIRLSWIVGTAGAVEAFLIVFVCCLVSLLTSFSMSAIATNGVVAKGGSYFMISRCLGPEFGGAVGILFYCGLSVSVAMYLVGSVEIFLIYMMPEMVVFGEIGGKMNDDDARLYGFAIVFFLAFVVYIGVKFVAKFASFTLAFVIVSIICIYLGIFYSNSENSVSICMLGDRILNYVDIAVNGNLSCDKSTSGMVHAMYCHNGTCDPYYDDHDIRLIPGIPGLGSGVFMNNLWPIYTEKGKHEDYDADIATSFIILLAIYFPSITGFEQGSTYSGDLRDAQQSIPMGTLWAVGSTSIIYLSSVLFFAACIERPLLRDKYGQSINGELVIAELCWPSRWVVVLGAFQSTVGAGLQALTGAPRLLQAIAKDNVIPFLSYFSLLTKSGEPFRGLVLTTIIALMGILIGKLDYVSPIVTMFFLMCYAFINLACALQSLLRLPNWRPRFWCYHWSLSLLGLTLCLTLMFISSWFYAIIAIGMTCAVYKYVEYKGAEKEWGDGMRGLAFSAALHTMHRLKQGQGHTKNWRPQLLLFLQPNDEYQPSHPKLIHFASQMKRGRGFTLLCSILEGNLNRDKHLVKITKQNLEKYIEKCGVVGFADVFVTGNIENGVNQQMQCAGLGALRPNTVILAWPENWRQKKKTKGYRLFLEAVRNVNAAHLSMLVLKGIDSFPDNSDRVSGSIDIWWIINDGGLLMLLPFLLTKNATWKNCNLRIFIVAQIEDNSIKLKAELEHFLYQVRIQADVVVVEMCDHDISDYLNERTLLIEQRMQMLEDMKINKKESNRDIQAFMDKFHNRASNEALRKNLSEGHVRVTSKALVLSTTSDIALTTSRHKNKLGYLDSSVIRCSQTDTSIEKLQDHVQSFSITSQEHIARIAKAVTMNEKIRLQSSEAHLVIINLPSRLLPSSHEEYYMENLAALTDRIPRVLMVRGSGDEVVTIYQ